MHCKLDFGHCAKLFHDGKDAVFNEIVSNHNRFCANADVLSFTETKSNQFYSSHFVGNSQLNFAV